MTEQEYAFTELAGKFEYDAGMSREEAEQKAKEVMEKRVVIGRPK